jgi:drug/metabolite transporter (DMT)-like permease
VIALLGIAGTGAVWALWYLLLERQTATRASVYLYLGPVISIGISAAFLREVVTPLELLGIVLVLGAAFVLDGYEMLEGTLSRRRSRPPVA